MVKQGSRYQTMEASLQRSKLWQHIDVIHLSENMRLRLRDGMTDQEQNSIKEFGKFLLRVGDCTETRYPERGDEVIRLPSAIVSKSRSIEDMITETFGDLRRTYSDKKILSERAIHVRVTALTIF